MIEWMKRNSSVWQKRHPVVVIDPRVICDGCGGKTHPETVCDEHPHHVIGRVNYSPRTSGPSGQYLICCDGTESHVERQ